MKQASARQKGKDFEKWVGEKLGNWWCGTPFCRSHGSGSASTIISTRCPEKKLYQAGDIYTSSDFPYSVECKNQMGWTLEHFLEGKCEELLASWWKQCVTDADRLARKPMLCLKRNCRKPLVCLRPADVFGFFTISSSYTIIRSREEMLFICLFEEFLVQVPSNVVRKALGMCHETEEC